MKRTYALQSKADFVYYSPYVTTESADGETIAANTYAYNDLLMAFRINDASASIKGAIEIPIGNLFMGDTVSVTAEVYNVSGVKAKIAVDGTGGTLGSYQSVKSGTFEKIKCKFTCIRNEAHTIALGVFTGDIGDYYIRNVEIEINSIGSNALSSLMNIPSRRIYGFVVTGGTCSLVSYTTNDTCTLTINTNDIKITHTKPFKGSKLGMSFAHITSSTNWAYGVRSRSEHKGDLTVEFYNTSTMAIVPISTILGLSEMYFNVIHFAYDEANV